MSDHKLISNILFPNGLETQLETLVSAASSTSLSSFLRALFAPGTVAAAVQSASLAATVEFAYEGTSDEGTSDEGTSVEGTAVNTVLGVRFIVPVTPAEPQQNWWLAELCSLILDVRTPPPALIKRLRTLLFGPTGPRKVDILIRLMRAVLKLFPHPTCSTGSTCDICRESASEPCAMLGEFGGYGLLADILQHGLKIGGALFDEWFAENWVMEILLCEGRFSPGSAMLALTVLKKLTDSLAVSVRLSASSSGHRTAAVKGALTTLLRVMDLGDWWPSDHREVVDAAFRILSTPAAEFGNSFSGSGDDTDGATVAELVASLLKHRRIILLHRTPYADLELARSALVDCACRALQTALECRSPTAPQARALARLAHHIGMQNGMLDEPRKFDPVRLDASGQVAPLVRQLEEVAAAIAVAMIPWYARGNTNVLPEAHSPSTVRIISGALRAALNALNAHALTFVDHADIATAIRFLDGEIAGRGIEAGARSQFTWLLLDAQRGDDAARPIIDPLAFVVAVRDIDAALSHPYVKELIARGVDVHMGPPDEVIDNWVRFSAMGLIHVPALPGRKLCVIGYDPDAAAVCPCSAAKDPFSNVDEYNDDYDDYGDGYGDGRVVDEVAVDAVYRKKCTCRQPLHVRTPEELAADHKHVEPIIAANIGRFPPFNHLRGVGRPLDIEQSPFQHLMQSGFGYGGPIMQFLGRAEHRAIAAVGWPSLLAVRRQYGHRGRDQSLALLPPR